MRASRALGAFFIGGWIVIGLILFNVFTFGATKEGDGALSAECDRWLFLKTEWRVELKPPQYVINWAYAHCDDDTFDAAKLVPLRDVSAGYTPRPNHPCLAAATHNKIRQAECVADWFEAILAAGIKAPPAEVEFNRNFITLLRWIWGAFGVLILFGIVGTASNR